MNWKPYNLSDFKKLQTNMKVKLGGLGAYNIGTEDWKKRKFCVERRCRYGNEHHILV